MKTKGSDSHYYPRPFASLEITCYMLSFIVQIALMASLAVIVYMLARALPRIVEESVDQDPQNALDRFVRRIPLEKLDVAIQNFFIKILRKTRLLVSKFDNLLNEYIRSLKKTSIAQSGQETIKEKLDLLVNGVSEEKGESIEEIIEESIARTEEEIESDIEEEKI